MESEEVEGRRELTRFRGGTNRLRIEIGRREGLEVEDRVCQFCYSGVEDEAHVMLDCNLYDDLRKEMIDRVYVNEEWMVDESRRMSMVSILLGAQEVGGVEKVGKERYEAVMMYLKKAMQRRDRIKKVMWNL